MSKTVLSNIVVPSVFTPYAIERSVTLSAILAAGIAQRDPLFDEKASGGGKTVDMPFWQDLTGTSEVLNDGGDLTLNNIAAGQDTAAINNRGKAWGANILTKLISGDDPMRRIADLVGGFWARDHQTTLLKILSGLFDPAAGVCKDTHLVNIYQDVAAGNITDAMRLTGNTFIDGTAKLGDASQRLVAVAMHSDTEAYLRKLDLIDTLPDSEGKPTIKLFQGRAVIVDDSCPKVAGGNSPAYTTYLFGMGAFALGYDTQMDPNEATEVGRAILGSDDILVSRQRFILHPRGVRWTPAGGVPAGASPTDAEFAGTGNWTKVYYDKDIRITAIRHNV